MATSLARRVQLVIDHRLRSPLSCSGSRTLSPACLAIWLASGQRTHRERVFTVRCASAAYSMIRNAFIFLTAANRLPRPSEGRNGTLCVFIVFIGSGRFNHRRWRVSQTFEREVTYRKVPARPSASLVMAITECQAAREEPPPPLSVAVSDVPYQVAGDRRVHSCVSSLQVCGCEKRT